MRLLLSVLLAALVLVGPAAGPSYACDCPPPSPAARLAAADVVVRGTVTRAVPLRSAGLWLYRIDVTESFKGFPGVDATVLVPVREACVLPGLRTGGSYVFFASPRDPVDPGEPVLRASACGGTAPATAALVSRLERLAGPPDLPVTMPDDTWDPDHPQGLAGWLTPWRLAMVGGAAAALLLLAGAGVLVVRANRR